MKKFVIFLIFLCIMLPAFTQAEVTSKVTTSSSGQDLDLTFEDDSDNANWGVYDGIAGYTTVAHNATGGVGGTGAIEFGDGGFGFTIKRPITATVGTDFQFSVDVKTLGWDNGGTYPITIAIEGIVDTPVSTSINSLADFTNIVLSGTATQDSGYISIVGSNTSAASAGGEIKVWLDNLVFDDDTQTPVSGPVTVTYMVNMSKVDDATDTTYTVQICGAEVGPEGQDLWQNNFLTWDDASPVCESVGGDYWKLSITYPDSMIGWRMAYKVRYKATEDPSFTWENYPDGNRMFVLPGSDTTLAMAYADNSWEPPYTETDSIDVYFRVNMSANPDFNPTTDVVYLVGALPHPNGSDNMWSPDAYPLTREGESSDYWGYDLKLNALNAPYTEQMYRFTLGSWDASENVRGHGMFPDNENRGVTINADTTLAWKWWNDIAPAGFEGTDTSAITFTANMGKANQTNGFNVGDTLLVKLGYFGSSSVIITDTLVRQGFSFNYAVTIDAVPLTFGTDLYYQYYVYKKGEELREVYYNFDYDGGETGGAERRIAIINDAVAAVNDTEDSESNPNRMPVFRNNDPLAQAIELTVECDLRPAIFTVLDGKTLTDIQANFTITPYMMQADPDTILKLGVCINGPMSNNGEGTWQTWGGTLGSDENRKMYDDGTHGDVTAGDSIYTILYYMSPDSSSGIIGQEFKFGIGGGDNEGGYGNNHIENIDDSQAATTLRAQFGSIMVDFYSGWDFDNLVPLIETSVDEVIEVPSQFSLEQNYPNPFNPTTNIAFALPKTSKVNLTVYDLTGKLVKTLYNNDSFNAGNHYVTWDASNNEGMRVPSGVYFYTLRTKNKVFTKKMLLLK